MYLIWNGIILRNATNEIVERSPTDFVDQTQLEFIILHFYLFKTKKWRRKKKIYFFDTSVWTLKWMLMNEPPLWDYAQKMRSENKKK